jgi:protein CpxP
MMIDMRRTFRGMFNLTRNDNMKTLKTLHTAFAAGLAALSLGAAVGAHAQTTATPQVQQQAQQQPHAQHGQRGQRHEFTPEQRAQFAAKRAERRAQRTAQLHDELAITPAQESAWKSFVASMQPAARDARHGQQDRAAWAGLSAPERMAKRIELHKQRTVAMEQRLGALNSFYSVLTPEQKRTFDTKANRLQGRRGWHGEQRQG